MQILLFTIDSVLSLFYERCESTLDNKNLRIM
jgi:hypothetical protein